MLARLICEHEPDKPSTAVTRMADATADQDGTQLPPTPDALSRTRRLDNPKRLRGRIFGDLDLIVLKALRKEPEQRYSSVEQFAAWRAINDGLGREHFSTQRAIERLVVLCDRRDAPEQARQWRVRLAQPAD